MQTDFMKDYREDFNDLPNSTKLFAQLSPLANEYRRTDKLPDLTKANEEIEVPWPLWVLWEAGFHSKKNSKRDIVTEIGLSIVEVKAVRKYRKKMIKLSLAISILRDVIAAALSKDGATYTFPDRIEKVPREHYTDHEPEDVEKMIEIQKTEQYYSMLKSEAQGIINHCANLNVFLAKPEGKMNSSIVAGAFENFMDVRAYGSSGRSNDTVLTRSRVMIVGCSEQHSMPRSLAIEPKAKGPKPVPVKERRGSPKALASFE